METLNILNKTEVTELFQPAWYLLIVILGFLFLIIGICMIIIGHQKEEVGIAGIIVFLVGFFGVLVYSFLIDHCKVQIPTGRYTYEVEITDDTDITYIYENYEVISNNGRVWTIEDKESEE